jgi:cell division protein DivIC
MSLLMQVKTSLVNGFRYIRRHMFWSLIVAAIVWLSFLSQHSLYAIFALQREKTRIQNEIVNYKDSIANFQQSIEEVSGDKDEMEVFAREKLLMKAADEDVFIIKDE